MEALVLNTARLANLAKKRICNARNLQPNNPILKVDSGWICPVSRSGTSGPVDQMNFLRTTGSYQRRFMINLEGTLMLTYNTNHD